MHIQYHANEGQRTAFGLGSSLLPLLGLWELNSASQALSKQVQPLPAVLSHWLGTFFFFFFCMWVMYVLHTCQCADTCACVCTYTGPEQDMGVLCHSLLYCLETEPLTECEICHFGYSGQPVSSWDPPVSVPEN